MQDVEKTQKLNGLSSVTQIVNSGTSLDYFVSIILWTFLISWMYFEVFETGLFYLSSCAWDTASAKVYLLNGLFHNRMKFQLPVSQRIFLLKYDILST